MTTTTASAKRVGLQRRALNPRCRVAAAPGRVQGDLHERADPLVDLQVRPLEGGELLGVGTLDLGRVLESPVERLAVAREDRADGACAVAHGDHVVERLARELVSRLAPCAWTSRSRRHRVHGPCRG